MRFDEFFFEFRKVVKAICKQRDLSVRLSFFRSGTFAQLTRATAVFVVVRSSGARAEIVENNRVVAFGVSSSL